MVLEKAVGPEILLWAFWGEIKSATHLTPMCQSQSHALTFLPTPPLPRLGFTCVIPGVHGRHWKDTAGEEEGTIQGIASPCSLLQELEFLCGWGSQRVEPPQLQCLPLSPLPGPIGPSLCASLQLQGQQMLPACAYLSVAPPSPFSITCVNNFMH